MKQVQAIAHTAWFRLFAILAVSAAMATAFSIPNRAGAQNNDRVKEITGLGPVEDNTVLGSRDLRETATAIINAALGLLGIIAVVVVIIGGFFWMTAGGNEEQIGKAKGYIFSGIIGLAIILSAFAISKFVIEQLGAATQLGGG